MGECPEWYDVIRAAKYLGVAPWELLAQPIHWRQWATAAEQAENEARRQLEAAAKKKGKKAA